jgi:hypothetical protein
MGTRALHAGFEWICQSCENEWVIRRDMILKCFGGVLDWVYEAYKVRVSLVISLS